HDHDVVVVGHRRPRALSARSETEKPRAQVSQETEGGGANPSSRCTATVCVSVYLMMPSRPWRRPSPELLTPPIGERVAPHAAAYAPLLLTAPARRRPAPRRPWPTALLRA